MNKNIASVRGENAKTAHLCECECGITMYSGCTDVVVWNVPFSRTDQDNS